MSLAFQWTQDFLQAVKHGAAVLQCSFTPLTTTTSVCHSLQAAEDDSGPKKKRHKSGKHAAEVGSRPQRSRRGQAEGSEEREQQPRQFAEVNEDEIVETDADRNFIDDEGECIEGLTHIAVKTSSGSMLNHACAGPALSAGAST